MKQNMRAYVRVTADNREVRLTTVPVPAIQESEVLIKVAAFGVGIHDRYFIPGDMGFPGNADFPYVIGSEGAGTIIRSGNQVTDFEIGDRVIFTSILQPQGGCWAEYASTSQSNLIPLPDSLSFEQGAAIPIAGKTALECMRAIELQKNEQIFIAGASGSIGTFVIQIASASGAHVAASASKKNHAYLRSLGVEQTVDYQDPNWKKQIRDWSNGGVTTALAIQPGTVADSMNVVRDGGKVITVSGNDQTEPVRNITIAQFEHHSDNQRALIQLISDIADSRIRLVIDHIYSFQQALSALAKTETRHAQGKTVVKFQPSDFDSGTP